MSKDNAALVGNLAEQLFLAPDGSNVESLHALLRHAVDAALMHQGEGPLYSGRPLAEEDEDSGLWRLPEEGNPPDESLAQLPQFLRGCVKPHHPFLAKNIIPLPSFVYLAAYSAASLFMGNGVTGEDAAAALGAELQCAAALADLAGYEPDGAAGVFTFGGTGTNLYAFKVGLSKADRGSTLNGVTTRGVYIGSWPSHYSHRTASTWLGVGRESYVTVPSLTDQTTDLVELEKSCRRAIEDGARIYGIIGAGGTTSNMAIDDFTAIAAMRDELVRHYALDYRPHIHADAVLGWAYLPFLSYDLSANPLGFSRPVCVKLGRLVSRLRTLRHADSMGIDFHKTGYVPYTSSMVLLRDRRDLGLLRRDGSDMTPLFHDPKAYNPGVYTLETSRSTANMIATWLTLRTLGRDGLRRLLGNALENAEAVREHLRRRMISDLVVVNQVSYGPDTFIRCYPPARAPRDHNLEWSSDRLVQIGNDYNSAFFSWLASRSGTWTEFLAVSKTSAAFYCATGQPVVALRVYSLNPGMGRADARELVDRLIDAKREFDEAVPSVEGS